MPGAREKRGSRGLRGALLVALTVLAAFSCAGSARAEVRITDQERVSDRVLELTIETPAFAEATKIQVNLPVGYAEDRSRRWPVTYALAGTMNSYNSFNSFLGGEKLSEGYPSIIVSPDPNSGYWSDWFNAGEFGPPMYETWVIDQLIPLIDARFRTVPDRSQRAIFGISMGGYGSLMLAARHPDMFAIAASLSGAVDSNLAPNGAVLSLSSTFDGAPPDAINGPRLTQEVRWRGHNPWDLADNLRGLDLQVRTANGVLNPAIGEGSDPAEPVSCVVEAGVYAASVSLNGRLDALGVPHLWKDYGPGCHTKPNFEREVTDTLAAFEKALADPPAPPKRFDYRSIEPRFEVWDWTVKADPARALEFLRMRRAGRHGVKLIGSGATSVKTPAFFRGLRAVDVVEPGGGAATVRPSRRGRLRLSVDLGAPHPDQQYTLASRSAGDGSGGYFTSRTLRFEPHARLRIGALRRRHSRHPKLCVRTKGAAIARGRVQLLDARKHAVRRRSGLRLAPGKSCLRLRGAHPRHLQPGRYSVRIRARDRYGHP